MKKALALLLALVMCLSLAACGGDADTETTTANVAQTQEATTQSDVTAAQPTETQDAETTQAEATTEATAENTTAKPAEKPAEKPATTAHTHSWKNATCTAPKKCSTCGATEGSAAGHSWSQATCTTPRKCSVCGKTDGTKGSHNPNGSNICVDCGDNVKAAEYEYLAAQDFRKVKREYSTAEANGAYVVVYTKLGGETWVVTYVSYKIISNYSVTTLHNLKTGETIEDPYEYYERLAERSGSGAYMSIANTVFSMEMNAMKGLSSVLSSGTHSGKGAYVSAAELNL